MLRFIIFLVLAGGMVYLAQHNLTPVTLRLGPYIYSGIPLFYIIIGSLLTGLGFSYLIQVINSVFTAFRMHGKDSKIKQSKNEIVQLTKRIHELESENEKLKTNATLVVP